MVIREEKKLLADLDSFLKKEKNFTTKEKEDFRRKKLIELRKGSGAGRPLQQRKQTSTAPLSRKDIKHIHKSDSKLVSGLDAVKKSILRNEKADIKRDNALKSKIKKLEDKPTNAQFKNLAKKLEIMKRPVSVSEAVKRTNMVKQIEKQVKAEVKKETKKAKTKIAGELSNKELNKLIRETKELKKANETNERRLDKIGFPPER